VFTRGVDSPRYRTNTQVAVKPRGEALACEQNEVTDHAARLIRHQQPDGFLAQVEQTVKVLRIGPHAYSLLL